MRIAIIPARSGSTRIKKKNIHPLCGKPMMGYPLKAASDSGVFDKIHVSTDSPEFSDVAAQLGHPTDFLRDPDLAENESSLLGTLLWTLDQYDQRGMVFDEVCMLYATAVLIDADDIIEGVNLYEQHGKKHPVLTVASFPAPIERSMIINDQQELTWMDCKAKTLHSQNCVTAYYDAAGFFMLSRSQLEAFNETIPDIFTPLVLPRWKAVDINDPEDLEMAEVIMQSTMNI